MKIKDVIDFLEAYAPLNFQESYDNAGLLTGQRDATVSGILITLDVTEEVIKEAITKKCNLIVAHHPVIFRGLKKLTGATYVERTIISALKHDIAIYAIHTNLDNVINGVNSRIADKIGLVKRSVLVPKASTLLKLETFVPLGQKEAVLEELYRAGAGEIGKYSQCSFQSKGTGTFKPSPQANPYIGKSGKLEEVPEIKAEVLLPASHQNSVLKALRASHPYEEVAYYLTPLENLNQDVGSGLIGELKEAMEPISFLKHLKDTMALECIRYTAPVGPVKKIAVCGGSGAFLISRARTAGADVYITADVKYHEFFDSEEQLMIADIGHYESEVYTKELIYDILSEKFSNFALNLSEIVTNPISYL